MNWNKRLNLAIAYIEDNLNGKLNINEAAKIACSSPFHFQRMFTANIGITLAEYARRRKLTKAATELTTDNIKIIDLASKYGYESPNAFTRLFRSMYGTTPSKARSSGVKLPEYHRECFHTEIEKGDNMNYKIIEKPAFEIVGKSKNFNYEEFIKEGPKFWKNYVGTKEYQSLCNINNGTSGFVTEAPLMSVYIPNKNGSRDSFTDVLALERKVDSKVNNFELFTVPSATYAEFNCTYYSSMKMNKYIYGEWFSSTGYERDGNKPDIAAYFPAVFRPMKDMRVRWWIPIIQK